MRVELNRCCAQWTLAFLLSFCIYKCACVRASCVGRNMWIFREKNYFSSPKHLVLFNLSLYISRISSEWEFDRHCP
jgi:hypothetical protein